MNYIDELKQILPPNVIAVACDLRDPDNRDLAWRYEHVKAVLSAIKASGKLILGGEVYDISEQRVELTWDTWDYKQDPSLSHKENAERSYVMTERYIESYHMDHGGKFCYSVVID